jgi:hypothetical protein
MASEVMPTPRLGEVCPADLTAAYGHGFFEPESVDLPVIDPLCVPPDFAPSWPPYLKSPPYAHAREST